MGILCVERMQGWEVIRPHVGQQRHCACLKGLFGRQQNLLHFSKTSRTEERLEEIKTKEKKSFVLSLVLILLNSRVCLKLPLFVLNEH